MDEITLRKQPSRWRVRQAIVRKEIFNILQHNYYVISLMVPLLMSLVFALMFAAINNSNQISLVIYDQGQSSLAETLRSESGLTLLAVNSEAELMSELDAATGGIIIPADFDTAVADGRQPELVVFTNSESRSSVQANMQKMVQEQIWLNQYQAPPANINWQEHSSDDGVFAAFSSENFLLLTLLTLTIAMAGIVILPQLMVEEKEKATLSVLLATPARFSDLVFGKATAVFFISLVLSGAVMLLNSGFVADWPITVAAAVLMMIFTIGVGVLFGIWVDTKYHCGEYSVILMLGLNMPVWFATVPADSLPALVQFVLRLIPTTYFINILMHSVTGLAAPSLIGLDFLVLTAVSLIVIGLVWWRVKWQSAQPT